MDWDNPKLESALNYYLSIRGCPLLLCMVNEGRETEPPPCSSFFTSARMPSETTLSSSQLHPRSVLSPSVLRTDPHCATATVCRTFLCGVTYTLWFKYIQFF